MRKRAMGEPLIIWLLSDQVKKKRLPGNPYLVIG
jgi:hypothetical protein